MTGVATPFKGRLGRSWVALRGQPSRRLLFHLVSRRYQVRSTLITTNRASTHKRPVLVLPTRDNEGERSDPFSFAGAERQDRPGRLPLCRPEQDCCRGYDAKAAMLLAGLLR